MQIGAGQRDTGRDRQTPAANRERDGRARGVVLEDGTEIAASARGTRCSRALFIRLAGEDPRILLDRVGEITDHAIQRHRHGALGQRRRDAPGDIEAGDVFGEFAFGAIGKGEGDLGGFDRL